MINTDSVEFYVKKPWEYKQSKTKKFFVDELGRHNFEHFVDFETWSRDSGEPVPKACQIPFVYCPKSLPISLKMKRWWEDREWYFSDVTNNFEGFEIDVPSKRIPEFIPEFFSIGKILTWALREQVNLTHVDFFCVSCALRDFASSATINRFNSKKWKYALFYFKGRIFIDREIDECERYWEYGLDHPFKFDHWSRVVDTPFIKVPTADDNPDGAQIFVPEFDLPCDILHREHLKYGKKFEDVLRTGGPGNPLYNGRDKELEWAKCDKLVSLSDHKIMTATRVSCQEPNGIIDSQENHVEMKTMYPHSDEDFAKYKALKLWIHCALVGIDAVYCGFRTVDGTLHKIKKYTMSELAGLGKQYWSPNEVLTFLDTFLSWLRETLNVNKVRRKKGEEWLHDYINFDEGATFTLSSGSECIRLEKADHPELRKIVKERFLIEEALDLNDELREVPDNWDDSD